MRGFQNEQEDNCIEGDEDEEEEFVRNKESTS